MRARMYRFANHLSRATLVLAIAVVLGSLWKRHIQYRADPYKCIGLRDSGQWHKSWSPPGCLLHNYTAAEIANCQEGGKMLFVGDSGTRQIFWATAKKIEGNSKWTFKEREKPDNHSNIEYSNQNANLKFLWDPWLNSSGLHEELSAFSLDGVGDTLKTKPYRLPGSRRTIAMLIGGGLWHARWYKTQSPAQFKMAIDNITTFTAPRNTKADWKKLRQSNKDSAGDRIFLAPVLEPRYERLSPSREATILPEEIIQMNDYLRSVSIKHGVDVLWSYEKMTRNRPESYQESGLHVVEKVASQMADVFLNLRCNDKAAQRDGYPFDRTCCNAYKGGGRFQMTLLFVLVILSLVAFKTVRCAAAISNDRGFERSKKWPPLSFISNQRTTSIPVAIVTVLMAACYCYIADRTQVFDKFGKQSSLLDFKVLIVLAAIACMLPGRNTQSPVLFFPYSDTHWTILPRHRSEELKGCMQVCILIYNYVGITESLQLYEILRTLLACYLFLSGYGHTMYFLQNQDYSRRRVISVLLRLNILAVLLSLMMDRPYASYYFAPLSSFWFLVVYATLRIWHHGNGSLGSLISKVLAAAVSTTCVIHIGGILEVVAIFVRFSGLADGTVAEWRARLAVDGYIVYVGMLTAILHIRISVLRFRSSKGAIRMMWWAGPLRILAISLSLALGVLFWFVSRSHTNREDYDWWMRYLSWLPVFAFIGFQNALGTYRCSAFELLGRASLELYLLSQHIWLAGDGNGLLSIGLRGGAGDLWNGGWRELVVLTPIFVWVAFRVSEATRTLVSAFSRHFL